jgi:hypothetical protein
LFGKHNLHLLLEMYFTHFKVQDATIGDKKYEKPLHYYYAIQKKNYKMGKGSAGRFWVVRT